MTSLYQPREAGSVCSLLGESPFWHPTEHVLYYVDIAGRRLNRFDPGSDDEQSWSFATEPGCAVPITSGGVLLARRDGIFRFDPVDQSSTLIAPSPCPDISVERFNDGKCDVFGRLWCGTVNEQRKPTASLYCIDHGDVQRREGGITTSNGMEWSPDNRTMYWSDTPAHTIYSFEYDAEIGHIGERRVFKRFTLRDPAQSLDAYEGRPDGAAVDSAGNYWVSMYEGSRLLQLSPAGDVMREVLLPVRCPTMPCFGGRDLKTLYITTVSNNRPAAELAAQPLAGHLLSMQVEIPGLPCHGYAM